MSSGYQYQLDLSTVAMFWSSKLDSSMDSQMVGTNQFLNKTFKVRKGRKLVVNPSAVNFSSPPQKYKSAFKQKKMGNTETKVISRDKVNFYERDSLDLQKESETQANP